MDCWDADERINYWDADELAERSGEAALWSPAMRREANELFAVIRSCSGLLREYFPDADTETADRAAAVIGLRITDYIIKCGWGAI